jgi:tetratricopeptide (TPR) repeat protein
VLRAANIAASIGPSPELAHALGSLSIVYAAVGREGSAMYYGELGIRIAEDQGSRWHIGVCHLHHGINLLGMAKWPAALEHLSTALEVLKACGDMHQLGLTYIMRIATLDRLGLFDQCISSAQEGYEILERTGTTQSSRPVLGQLWYARGMCGELQESRKQLEAILPHYEKSGDKLTICSHLRILSEILFLARDDDTAIEYLERAIAVYEKHGVYYDDVVFCYHLAVRAYIERAGISGHLDDRDQKRLRQLVKRSLKLSRKNRQYRSLVLMAAGCFSWSTPKQTKAFRLFEQAIAEAQKLGSPPYEAVCAYEYGRRLIRHSPREQKRGKQLLSQAKTQFELMKLEPYREWVEAVLAQELS